MAIAQELGGGECINRADCDSPKFIIMVEDASTLGASPTPVVEEESVT